MTRLNSPKTEKTDKAIYRFTTDRRTITETDTVNFVNLVGLHEAPFIDMEWIKDSIPEKFEKRFAPAPFLISVGMGLVAPVITNIMPQIMEEEKLGLLTGMVGVEAKIQISSAAPLRGSSQGGPIPLGPVPLERDKIEIKIPSASSETLW